VLPGEITDLVGFAFGLSFSSFLQVHPRLAWPTHDEPA
jgi:Na+(H+)/acetate symporter ActP